MVYTLKCYKAENVFSIKIFSPNVNLGDEVKMVKRKKNRLTENESLIIYVFTLSQVRSKKYICTSLLS